MCSLATNPAVDHVAEVVGILKDGAAVPVGQRQPVERPHERTDQRGLPVAAEEHRTQSADRADQARHLEQACRYAAIEHGLDGHRMHHARSQGLDQPDQLAEQAEVAQRIDAGPIDGQRVVDDAVGPHLLETARIQGRQIDLEPGFARGNGDRQTVRHEERRVVDDKEKATASHCSHVFGWGSSGLTEVEWSATGQVASRRVPRPPARGLRGRLAWGQQPTCPNANSKDGLRAVTRGLRGREARPWRAAIPARARAATSPVRPACHRGDRPTPPQDDQAAPARPRARSRSRFFWTLPVEVLGSSAKTTVLRRT